MAASQSPTPAMRRRAGLVTTGFGTSSGAARHDPAFRRMPYGLFVPDMKP
jgi:hypothetical protein